MEKNSDCKFIDMYFKNRRKYLILQCECTSVFEVTWSKFNRNDARPKRQCNECSLLFKKSKNINQTINGFYILDSYSTPTENSNKTLYRVKCVSCGLEQERISTKVLSGNAKCDCQKDYKQRNCDRSTRLGSIHHGMLQRCENPNNDGYKYYGGKGISVCNEWQSFEPFEEWSLNNGYFDNLTIDRIDYNKGYSPDNCRWATYKTQANNKTDNHMLTYKGRTKNVQMWGEELGIKPNTIITRLRRGWSVEEALYDGKKDTRALTKEDVLYIKANYIPRKVSAQKLADKFGVSKTTVLDILNNKTYTDIFFRHNLYEQCKTCKNLYSSLECEMCEDFDMYIDDK